MASGCVVDNVRRAAGLTSTPHGSQVVITTSVPKPIFRAVLRLSSSEQPNVFDELRVDS